MDISNPDIFAHIPKDILTDRRLSLPAKGLYSVICTFPVESPVTFSAVLELLGCEEEYLDKLWDEMMSFMNLREKEEELQKALAEMQQNTEKQLDK